MATIKLMFINLLLILLLCGCGEKVDEKNDMPLETSTKAENSTSSPLEKDWKIGTYPGGRTFINLVSDYAGLGDILIECASGFSTFEFISAKPINSNGKMSYRIEDSKPINMVWINTSKNGFSSLTPKNNEYIKMLKAFYVSSEFHFSFLSTSNTKLESKFSTFGFKEAINNTRQECGWTVEDFPM